VSKNHKAVSDESNVILQEIEGNEHPPICGLKDCGYRLGWARSERNHELRMAQEEKNRVNNVLERKAAFCDSVPAFARTVLRFHLGDGSPTPRSLEETAKEFGLKRHDVLQIIDVSVKIVAEIDEFGRRQTELLKWYEERLQNASITAANAVVYQLSTAPSPDGEMGGSR
jgi:hypothetical protein